LGVETGRSCESDVDRSQETGEEGGDAEDGHGELPGDEFTDCGTPAELSAATIALEISGEVLPMAERRGFGSRDVDAIWVRGNDIEQARRPFRKPAGWTAPPNR